MNVNDQLAKDIQQKNVLLSQATTLVSRGLTSETRTQYDKLMASVDELEQSIALRRKLIGKLSDDASAKIDNLEARVNRTSAAIADRQNESRAAQNKAWFNYLTKGESRDLTVTSGNALINQEFSKTLFDAAKAYGEIAFDVTRLQDDGVNPVQAAFYDDTASYMSLVSETTEAIAPTDPANIRSDITATDTLASSMRYSFQMDSDTGFDFGVWLASVAAVRVGRSLEYAVTNGKDNATAGNALPLSPAGGLLASLQSAGSLATAGQITYSDLHSLYSSIDPAYRLSGSFYAHSTVHDNLAGQLDGFGKPYYKVNPDTGRLILVAGKELKINQAMPALATSGTGTPQVIFGDMSKAYAVNISDTRIKILRETYAASLLKAAVVYVRLGATAGLPGAAKVLFS